VLLPIEPESPQHAMALVMRAHAQLRLGDFGSAVETLAEAEERYPDQPEARIARIGALLNERHFDEARQALDEARAALDNPDAEEVLRGFEIQLHLAQFQDDPDAALAALRALADADPYDPRIWQALTQGMIQAGRSEEALSLLTDAIEEDPGRLFLYSPLASLLRASGRGDEARDALRALVERSPSPTAFLGLAQHHALEATDPDATRATLEEGLAAFPDDPQLLRALAETELSYADPGEPHPAVDHYRALFPEDPSSEYLLARLELARGDADAAAERLTQVMPLLDQAFTQYWLGRALEATGDDDGAERRYQRASQTRSVRCASTSKSIPSLPTPLAASKWSRWLWRWGSQQSSERAVRFADSTRMPRFLQISMLLRTMLKRRHSVLTSTMEYPSQIAWTQPSWRCSERPGAGVRGALRSRA
jgi:predicted Zn-dependent protease